jgi:Bacteriophage T4-like portal protein (Gp20)
MAFELFGYSIGKVGKAPPSQRNEEITANASFAPPSYDDGALPVTSGVYFSSYMDFDGGIKATSDMIRKYREMSLYPEVEMAIADICDESIVYDDSNSPVEIKIDDKRIPPKIKEKIEVEFDEILRLLKFQDKGYEIFRKWYIDGRLYYHKIIDKDNPKQGLVELRPIEATNIRKVRNITKKKDQKTSAEVVSKVDEFFIYNEREENITTTAAYTPATPLKGVKIAPDSICYVHSGLFDAGKKRVLSYIHKALKPMNQLKMVEDALVIYRLSRAPERRVFYVDVGNLPKAKAEQYLKEIMNRYRNKLVYDASTGEMKDERRHMSMLEDFWMPRREGGKGTEVTTLPGGQNLGQMDDVLYFQKKLYKSLNVPISRLETDQNGFNMGRQAEITRDELKFFRFIERLRKKFSELFRELLKTQLILKGVITKDDWEYIHPNLEFRFRKDSYFTEAKDNEILTNRYNLVTTADAHIGKYFSKKYIQKTILRMTNEEIADIENEIQSEKETDPNAAVPTSVSTQVTTQQMTGDIQMQQQMQQMQHQSDLEQEAEKEKKPAKKKA